MALPEIDQTAVVPDAINPAQVTLDAPPAPRSGLAEVGTGLARGALVGLPSLVGRAAQYAGAEGFGRGLVQSAEERGKQSWLTMQPEAHGGVVNALASGAEMLAPSLAPVAALGAGAAALGAGPALAGAAAIAGSGALFGAEAGQHTLEKAKAAGVPEDEAKTAARLNAAQTFAGQTALGYVGGKMLGLAGNAIGKAASQEGSALAGQVLDQLAGTNGVLMPTLKATGRAALEGSAVNAAQAAGTAAIEQGYGIDQTDPLTAAKDSIIPTLGLTALMSPMGLVSRGMAVRSAKARTETLTNPETAPDLRTQLANQYADQLAKVDPASAAAFRANAATAIAHKQQLPVDSTLFTPGTITAPQVAEPPARLENNPSPLTVFPDGTVGTRADVENYINGLPEDQQVAARARLMGLGAQPAEAPAAAPAAPALLPAPEPGVTRGQDVMYTFPDGTTTNSPADVENYVSTLPENQRGAAMASLMGMAPQPIPVMARSEFGAASGLKGQKLAKEYAAYRADPLKYESDLRAEQEAAAVGPETPPPSLNALPEQPAAPAEPAPRVNTQLADALDVARRKQQEDAAYAELAARKQAQLDAIGNVGAGARQAAAAEAGTIRPNENAPKQPIEIQADLSRALEANNEAPRAQDMAWLKSKLTALGIDKLPDHNAQIDALQAAVDATKKASPGYDRLRMLLDTWRTEAPRPAESPAQTPAPVQGNTADRAVVAALTQPQPPASAAALPENIPKSAPDTAPQPLASAAAQAALPDNTGTIPERRQAAADKVDAALADFTTRLRSGEQLTALEKERFEDLNGFRRLLSSAEGKGLESQTRGVTWTPDYLKEIEGFVDEASSPYKDTLRQERRGALAEPDMALVMPGLVSRRVHDVFTSIAENSTDAGNKALAQKLADLNLPTKLVPGFNADSNVLGEYNRGTDTISINPGGSNEHTVLHESVHAATARAIDTVANLTAARDQKTARALTAYKELEAIRKDALTRAPGAPDTFEGYGLSSAHEFVAELHTNPEFQQLLRDTASGKTTLWNRAVDAVRKLLGLQAIDRDVVSRAMTASEAYFDLTQAQREFDASPAGAARATDTVLQHVIGQADRAPLDLATVDRKVFEKLLPWKTVQYIADRARAIPELVASGFSAGLDSYQAAHRSRQLAAAHLETPAAMFSKELHANFNKLPADKARALDRQLMTIGGEASRMGFDYTKNFNDNLKDRPDLSPANKAYIDDIYRQYTQLPPEAQKALVQGEQLNRKDLLVRMATLAANYLDARAGVSRRLQADLSRLAPEDPTYQAAAARAALANLEGGIAGVHAPRLDFMDPTLAQGKNSNSRKYYDQISSNLATRLNEMFDAVRKLPEGSDTRVGMAELEKIYRAQETDPYFSLGRSGDFFVKVGFKDMTPAAQTRIQEALKGTNKVLGDLTGQSHAFFRVNSMDEAAGLAKKLQDAGQGTVVDPAWGAQAALLGRANGITPALRKLFDSLSDVVDGTPGLSSQHAQAMQQALTRELLSMLPETASRSARMQRRGVPGYDADFLNTFVRRAGAGAKDTANLYAQRAFTASSEARAASIDQLNRTGSAEQRVRAQLINNEIETRYLNSTTPLDNSMVNMVNSLSHSYFLGMSPAFLIRTMAQPWHRGLPWLGSRYGFVPAMTEIAAATPAALKLVAESMKSAAKTGSPLEARIDFRNLNLSPSEQSFVKELNDRGVLQLGQSQQLQQMAVGGNQRTQNLVRLSALTAQYAETTNRMVTGLAAYRLAMRKGMSAERATDYAVESINNVMDNFDPGNTARAIGRFGFAGSRTPLLTQFTNYSLQTMQQLARTVHDGYFGQDPSPAGIQRGKEARAEFKGLLATTAMLSGAMGLPFVNAAAGVYNSVANLVNPDDPSDIRADARRFLATTFGNDVGQILAHGPLAAAGMGVDTSTLGLADLLPGSEFLASRQAWSDRLDSQAANMLGPAASMGFGIAKALGALTDGNYVKAVEQMLPTGLKAPYKAAELAGVIGPGGFTDARGNPLPLETTGTDIGWQALGFQSAARALQGEAARDFSADQQAQARRKALISDRVFKGATQTGDVTSALQDIVAYNQANPLQPVTDVGGALRNRLVAHALGAASGTGVAVGRRQLPALMNSEFYASMPRY